MLLILLIGSGLGCMFAGDFAARLAEINLHEQSVSVTMEVVIRGVAWRTSGCILALSFAVLYFWAPDWEQKR
jgi:membrane protein